MTVMNFYGDYKTRQFLEYSYIQLYQESYPQLHGTGLIDKSHKVSIPIFFPDNKDALNFIAKTLEKFKKHEKMFKQNLKDAETLEVIPYSWCVPFPLEFCKKYPDNFSIEEGSVLIDNPMPYIRKEHCHPPSIENVSYCNLSSMIYAGWEFWNPYDHRDMVERWLIKPL